MSLRVQTTPDINKVESAKLWSNPQGVKPTSKTGPGSEIEQMSKEDKPNEVTKVDRNKDEANKAEAKRSEVESAVENINSAMEHINRGLKFSIHEDTQRVMVKVVNVATQEVIKELPPEDVLDTVARIREMIGLLIDERA